MYDSECKIERFSPELMEEVTTTASNLLPAKSGKAYEKIYSQFMDWRYSNKISNFTENIFIDYFNELSKKLKSTSLWAYYSILKSTLSIKDNIDISKYPKLHALLKQKSEGYEPKKSKTFSTNEIKQFINEAPDFKYLMFKVACIFGIMGACRRYELHKLENKDVKDFEPTLLVTIRNTQTRKFTISGKYYEICKKYMNLRPKHCTTPAFFLNYFKGRCTAQNVGINKFGNIGKQIATYLKLPDSNSYTGHCFRRTSETILDDVDGDISLVKQHDESKSTTVVETYNDESIETKIDINDQIIDSIEYNETNNTLTISPTTDPPIMITELSKIPQFHFNNCTINSVTLIQKES